MAPCACNHAPMEKERATAGGRWSPVWAFIVAVLALIPFAVVGGSAAIGAFLDAIEPDPSNKMDGVTTILGSIVAVWAFIHALPWMLYLWRRKKHWFIFGVVSLVLAGLMVLGIKSLLYGQTL